MAPRGAIRSYLSTKGSAHIDDLARIGDTTPDIAESIVRDLAYRGDVLYHGDNHGSSKVAEWVGGF
ncbi:MAG: hypothetical protein V1678_04280 [Candidatus Aenigmatarchaeota archaeon]